MNYNETTLFNVYAHFGAWALGPTYWPKKKDFTNHYMYYTREYDRVYVKHGLKPSSGKMVVGSDADRKAGELLLGKR